MKRRDLLTTAPAVLAAFCAGNAISADTKSADAKSVPAAAKEPFVWQYTSIDPDKAAAYAYEIYPDGSCMYASFRSIVESVGKKRMEVNPEEAPYWTAIPYRMMYYGRGGVHDYGSLCGVLNGCAAAISLFVTDKKVSAAMARELFGYYESTALPIFEPKESKFSEIEQTTAESVLCHISMGRWCAEADAEAESARRKERCKRLTADGVKKTIELLNRYFEALKAETACEFAASGEPAASCIVCHSPEGEQPKTNVRMNCNLCHDDLADDHGKR